VVRGKKNVWLASSDILLPGPFESTEEMNVIQEESGEVNKTLEMGSTTSLQKGNNRQRKQHQQRSKDGVG
jgi:hypothetical protein